MLECKRCEKNVSPANPAKSAKHHKCKPEALAAARVSSSPGKQPRDVQVEVGMPVAKKAATAMDRFTVSAVQLKSFHMLFAIHLIWAEGGWAPLNKVECPGLRQVPDRPDFIWNFWISKAAKDFPKLAFAANKLLSAHTTTAAAERNWSAWGRTYTSLHANLSLEPAEKAVYVKTNMLEKWYS